MGVKSHPCGLTTSAVRQHQTGSRLLGNAGKCALENWKEAERLKAIIENLNIRIDALEKALQKQT